MTGKTPWQWERDIRFNDAEDVIRSAMAQAWEEGYKASDDDSCEAKWVKRPNPYRKDPNAE